MFKLFYFVALIATVQSAKLNVPKLLLPYHSSAATNFTLEVNTGCFTWRSTRPEIASILPENPTEAGCSQQAVVTATSRVPTKKTAIVIAEDTVSGQQLRCDVIIDEIHRIEIETTTHELYLDDSPEEFIIRASNAEDDEFSSINGHSFEWTLLPDTSAAAGATNLAPAHNILRILTFSESSYAALPHIKVLESAGRRGDRVLVRGEKTGAARIGARLDDPVYKKVKESYERIIVMANIQINPPVVYLLQHADVTYSVELVKHTQIQVLPMPSSQYFLEVDNTSVATLDPKSSTATAATLGDTEVKLKDKHINIPGIFREPSAALYVVNPGYLEFVVLPTNNWVLETSRVYVIVIHVYDQESHRIHPSNNVRIAATFPAEHFRVHFSSDNGTYHVVETLKRGFPVIDGTLRAVLKEDGYEHVYSPPVQGSQDVEIYDPVTVTPKLVVLPWTPVALGNKKAAGAVSYTLQVSGGSGNYSWTSSDRSVMSVNQRGVLTAATVTGETKVKATDARNAEHYDTMTAHVLPPGEMEFLPSRVEAEIGTTLDLPLAVYAVLNGERLRFADCQQMALQVQVKDGAVFSHVSESPADRDAAAGGACVSVRVRAESLGHTAVTAVYSGAPGGARLQAKVTIAAYRPLRPVTPATLVTPGSSRQLLFEGGPQPWVLDPATFYRRTAAADADSVTLTRVQGYEMHKSQHVFVAACLELGEQELTLHVGNAATATNRFPAQAAAAVRFACAEPRSLRLVPDVKRPTGTNLPPCPISAEFDEPVPVYNYRDLKLLVTVTDQDGRRFDNFSSAVVEWTVSDESLATFHGNELVTEATVGAKGGVSTWRMLAMQQKVGVVSVTAAITQYDKKTSRRHKISATEPISSTRTLDLVEDALITPDTLTIYSHQQSKPGLRVERGSGHFLLDHGDADATETVAMVTYDAKTRNVDVAPKTEGQMKVTAWDLCLEVVTPAAATVVISDVHQVTLRVVDKVEIGREIRAVVQVLDRRGEPVPAALFPAMAVTPRPADPNVIAVRPSSTPSSSTPHSAEYVVTGAALGRTSLAVSARQKSGKVVTSPSRPVQVFPPLRLTDDNITLIVGSVFQVTASGGPEPQSSVRFAVENATVAGVGGSGLVEAREVGVTTVTGRAVGTDADVVYSQATVTIHVIPLSAIRIFAPLKRLQTGTQMGLYAVGRHGETPFSLGTAVPALRFHWSISNTEVAALRPVYWKSGIVPAPDNNLAVRLFAEDPGHVTVSLRVDVPAGQGEVAATATQLVDSVQIQVFPRLLLVAPSVCDGELLITPSTETRVATNRDGSAAALKYTVQQSPDEKPVVSVDEFGRLVSGPHRGEASLVVTALEDFGVNQTLVILVKVRPVSYLLLSADTSLSTRPGESLPAVPVGAILTLTVSFHDVTGERFTATSSKIQYRPSRYDLLQISHGSNNDTLLAKATNIGQTVLKVWDATSGLTAPDYISVSVGYAVSPADAPRVLLGDVICFDSPIVSAEGHSGVWSSPSASLDINPETGIAVATHVGMTAVMYNVSAAVVTHAQVSVGHIFKVSLDAGDVEFLTNVAVAGAFRRRRGNAVRVRLEDQNGRVTATLHGSNCSARLSALPTFRPAPVVRCEVTLSKNLPTVSAADIVTAEAAFNPQTGGYECRLTETATSLDRLPLVSSLDDVSVQLRAVVEARDSQPAMASAVLSLPFVPTFYVFSSDVQLSDVIPSVSLRVAATATVRAALKVTSSDPGLVQVATPDLQDGVLTFPVTLTLTKSLWERSAAGSLAASISLRCSVTGQEQTVPVHIKLVAPKADNVSNMPATWGDLLVTLANNYHNIIFMLLCVIATVSCIVIAYHAVIGQRYQAAGNTSNVFMSPGSPQSPHIVHPTSPWTPHNSSGGGAPGSPGSRLWSVDYGPYEASLFKRSPSPAVAPRK